MRKINRHIWFILFLLTCILGVSMVYKVFESAKPQKRVKASMHDKDISKDENPAAKRIIYLTFDDGPSPTVTDEILDTLKKKEVKATFFIVAYKIKGNEKVLKRIHDEGNGIGLHSYTHEYKKMYKNNESFINEMTATEDELYKAIGVRTKIIRFPSGSKKHMNMELADKLHEHGYKVFDWNACASDGISYRIPPERLYNEVIKSSKKWTKVYLLLHCDEVNKNTCRILPKVIDHFKENEYEFRIIDNNTPEYHFRICQ